MSYNYPTRKLVFYAGVTFLIVYTGLLLAMFTDVRQKTVSRVSTLYRAAFKGPEKVTVTRAAIPENKPVQVVVQNTKPQGKGAPAGALPHVVFPPGLKKGVLSSRPAPERPTESQAESKREETAPPESSLSRSRASEREEAAPVSKGKGQQEAYAVLLQQNKPMADLVANADPNLKFKNWSGIKSEGDAHWIDLVFLNKSDGREVHYIWQVNPVSKEIHPINYQARKLAVK
jgi:hypothetical protein